MVKKILDRATTQVLIAIIDDGTDEYCVYEDPLTIRAMEDALQRGIPISVLLPKDKEMDFKEKCINLLREGKNIHCHTLSQKDSRGLSSFIMSEGAGYRLRPYRGVWSSAAFNTKYMVDFMSWLFQIAVTRSFVCS